MLNVTHFDWTRNNIRPGLKISRLTGGKHFIISTAFNGHGAAALPALLRAAQVAADQRLVPPPAPRAGAAPNHDHRPSERRRLHVDRPPGVLGRLLQRRTTPGRQLVAEAGADVLEIRHRLDRVAPGGHRFAHR